MRFGLWDLGLPGNGDAFHIAQHAAPVGTLFHRVDGGLGQREGLGLPAAAQGPEQGHGLQRRVSRCRRNDVLLLVLSGLGRDARGKIGAARVVLLKRQLGGAPGGFGGLLEQGQALAGTDEGTHGVLGFLQCL